MTYSLLLLEPDSLLVLQQERVPRLLHVQVAATHIELLERVELLNLCVCVCAEVAASRRKVQQQELSQTVNIALWDD